MHPSGFIMVDHPDFCSERELEKAKATLRFQLQRDGEDDDDDDDEDDEAGEDPTNGEAPPAKVKKASAIPEPNPIAAFDPAVQSRSLTSIRSGVTVAMVAVALGFACCESGAFSSKWLLQNISVMTNFIFSSAPICTGENVFHIFIYNRSNVRSGKIWILIELYVCCIALSLRLTYLLGGGTRNT
jgi:hypothetical protein